MQFLNKISYRQWLTLLLFYLVLTPIIHAKPTAILNISPRIFGQAPFTVTLDGSKSIPSAGADIVEYSWRSTAGGFMLSDSVQVKVFNVPGKYTVWLTVTDSTGQSDETSQTVTVSQGSTSNFGFSLGNAENSTFFYGDIVLSGGIDLENNSSFSQEQVAKVTATMTIPETFIGKPADILVAVLYVVDGKAQWFAKTESTAVPFIAWDGVSGLSTMAIAKAATTLNNVEEVVVLTGHLEGLPGDYKIYMGYSLLDGSNTVVHNAIPTAQPIAFKVQ